MKTKKLLASRLQKCGLLLVLFWLSNVITAFAQNLIEPKNASTVIPGQYIVVYHKTSKIGSTMATTASTGQRKELIRQEAETMLKNAGISQSKIAHIYESALYGFSVKDLTGEQVEKLRKSPQVAYIEPDRVISTDLVKEASDVEASEPCLPPHLLIEGEAPNFEVGTAVFGTNQMVSGQIVFTNQNPCNPPFGLLPSGVTGPKIIMVDRGFCSFNEATVEAQAAGAVGVIIANNVPGQAPPSMGGGGNQVPINIPVISITLEAANLIKTAISNNTVVNATLYMGIPNSTFQCMPWGVARVGGGATATDKRAWIIDSGIDVDHPDLNVDIPNSVSFIGAASDFNDLQGHGTHVAGTVAAIDNGQGVIGVAAGAKVVAVRVLNAEGFGSSASIIAGINFVAGSSELSPDDVANLSLGGPPNNATNDAIMTLAAKCKVVIAAGNDAKNVNFVSPARVIHPNVYTISAMDQNDALTSFSNFGAAIRYSSPGLTILSTYLEGTYANLSGTSMAAPHITGLLLLGVDLCASKRITNDRDGMPDPILTVATAADNTDSDGDGFTPCNGDLDDTNATIFPTTEICDGIDNDNDGLVDEGNVCCPSENPTRLYVKTGSPPGNTGLSWADAFGSLQSALALASKCSAITEIWVAAGTYSPSADEFGNPNPIWNTRTVTFSLRNGLAVYGGFAGNEAPDFDLSQRDFLSYRTILDGEFQNNGNPNDNAFHVISNSTVFGQGMDAVAILDGLTIRRGVANLLTSSSALIFPFSYGGGVFNFYANTEIRNSLIMSNTAYHGGAMFNFRSEATLKNTQFNQNTGYFGAGISNQFSSPLIQSCSFQINQTTQEGAAISNYYGSNPIILNASFAGNQATQIQTGATISNRDACFPKITNSIIWGNSFGIKNQTDPGIAPSAAQIDYSIVQGLTTGARLQENLNVDPLFVIQPTVGGPTLGNLSLQPCSPALNAGDPTASQSTYGDYDVLGSPRIFGDAIDIGSFELQRAEFAVSITANPGLDILEGESVTLTGSGAISYIWSTTGTTPEITVTPAATTRYTVTGQDGDCSGTAEVTVTVDGLPLPVSLISFSAKAQPNGTVQLAWSTSDEKDNARYELEKSKDLISTNTFAQVAPLQSDGPVRNYAFVDEVPYKGRSYYRLKQIDLDGKENIYHWASVHSGSSDYTVFPNPVVSRHFSLTLDEPETAVLKLFTMEGKSVDLKVVGKKADLVNLEIPAQLPPGIYLLSVEEKGQTNLHRMMIGQ